MAGRTERAIIGETLAMAGVSDPARHVDEFVAELTRRRSRRRGRRRGPARPGRHLRRRDRHRGRSLAPFPSYSSVRGMVGSVSRAGSTRLPPWIIAWMSSLTSHTLTFIPATTAP